MMTITPGILIAIVMTLMLTAPVVLIRRLSARATRVALIASHGLTMNRH